MLSDKVGAKQHDIMFSSNATPDEDFKLAYKLGAIINLDDFTHIDVLDKLTGIPETIKVYYSAELVSKLEIDVYKRQIKKWG